MTAQPQRRRKRTSACCEGLSVEESAEVAQVLPATVIRDWNTAGARLYLEMSGETRDGS